jgi:hypothetical protein
LDTGIAIEDKKVRAVANFRCTNDVLHALSVGGDIVKSESRRIGVSVRLQYSAQKIALEPGTIGEIGAQCCHSDVIVSSPIRNWAVDRYIAKMQMNDNSAIFIGGEGSADEIWPDTITPEVLVPFKT